VCICDQMSLLDIICSIKVVIVEIQNISKEFYESSEACHELCLTLRRVSPLLSEVGEYVNKGNIEIFRQFLDKVVKMKEIIERFNNQPKTMVGKVFSFMSKLCARKEYFNKFLKFHDSITQFIDELSKITAIKANTALLKCLKDVSDHVIWFLCNRYSCMCLVGEWPEIKAFEFDVGRF